MCYVLPLFEYYVPHRVSTTTIPYVYESGGKKIRNSMKITLWRKWRLKLGDGVWVVCVCGGSG